MKALCKLIVFMLASAAVVRAEPEAISVAVFDFQTSGGTPANQGAEAAMLLSVELSKSPAVDLVERVELDKLLSEQEFSLSGSVSVQTAVKVGQLTGAQVFITGRLFDSGPKHYLVAKLMSTETSRVFGEAVTFTEPESLSQAVAALAPKILLTLSTKEASLRAAVETEEARWTRLRVLLGARKRMTVAVSVAEQHLGRAGADPAVETELKAGLQQLGFEVLDAASPTQAAVRITGEAFSEPAARRRGLISCRARVELKALRVADGQQLRVDRQTSSAVDVAEQVAGKKALQEAATALLERLVPALVE